MPLPALLGDASDGIINCVDARAVPGFAAHGSSIGDSLRGLIDVMGVELVERDSQLMSPSAAAPLLLAQAELGCDADDEPRPRSERLRAPEMDRPTALSMTYYDPARDYQAGQMRASSGATGARDERIELPAVLSAGQAKILVEEAFARRWRNGDKFRLRLPPARMGLRPGQAVQLDGSGQALLVRSVTIEGMAVAVEAEAAPITIPPLPAAPGRGVSEPDLPVGRTELALFELPAAGDAPDATIKAYAAGSNTGLWKGVPVELALGAAPLPGIAVARRSILGVAETVLEARAPLILDELSAVVVRLACPTYYLLNTDHDGLMAGANLAILGDELIQFGRAEQLGAGLYRLSRLLRGRRGTEWAAAVHAVGDRFAMIDPSTMASIELSASAIGSTVTATAHGIGDIAPLPIAARPISGESLRPPSPCHLRLFREGSMVHAEWTRRSHRGWAWTDGVGVGGDPFPELYRLTLIGPAGQLSVESATTSAVFDIPELPADPGEQIDLAVSTVGPAALSRAAMATIIL